MISNYKNLFNFEKKSVFYVNFFLVLLIVIFFIFKIPLSLFFYFDIVLTFILSFLFFKRSRKVAKFLILTNMFIFFYFLYPQFSNFLYNLFGDNSYFIVLFYTLFLGFIFILLSGFSKTFMGKIKKFDFKFAGIIVLMGFILGFFFYMVREPVPQVFIDFTKKGIFNLISFLTINSFVVALAEELVFVGFLFNVYNKLTTKVDAIFQTSLIFTMFHLLRFHNIIIYYFENFRQYYIFYSSMYYILLFSFMVLALYLYSFKGKKKSGNFLYPVILHLITDLILFLLYILFGS